MKIGTKRKRVSSIPTITPFTLENAYLSLRIAESVALIRIPPPTVIRVCIAVTASTLALKPVRAPIIAGGTLAQRSSAHENVRLGSCGAIEGGGNRFGFVKSKGGDCVFLKLREHGFISALQHVGRGVEDGRLLGSE